MQSDTGQNAEVFHSDRTPYEVLGGEVVVRALANAFYTCMDTNEAYAELRAIHDSELTPMQEKFFKFLSGWLGGPQLYVAEHGHPRLRMRHAPFSIDESMRDQWLACMAEAMDLCGIEGDVRSFLDARFAHVANFMRNTS